MTRAALKIVEAPSFRSQSIELSRQDPHSLHLSFGAGSKEQLSVYEYFVDRFTSRGDVILDPFCGFGSRSLQANLMGRVAYSRGLDPLATRVTEAKLSPADLTEVTLCLQQLHLHRPLDLNLYSKHFSPFYDLETFRELSNLRYIVQKKDGRVMRFLELLAMGILHGPSAGYLSVYTLPQVCLSPSDQRRLNEKRGQTPDYRSLAPRILRRAASSLRDGIPTLALKASRHSKVCQGDARDLSFALTSEAALAFIEPPLPGSAPNASANWIEAWLCGLPADAMRNSVYQFSTRAAWLDFMNELLLEVARVVRSQGRVVLDLSSSTRGLEDEELLSDLTNLCETNLGRFWEAEADWNFSFQDSARRVGLVPHEKLKPWRFLSFRRK